MDEDHESAKNNLIARDAVLYKKTMFRAILYLTKDECEQMTIQDYLDYSVLLKEVIKIMHLPYLQNG